MTKKQKKMLYRILTAVALMIVLALVPSTGIVRFLLYMVPYLVVGYDILKKAWKGILNKQVFDENFLMAIATVGAIIIAVTGEGDYTEAVAVMLFYQIGELFQSYAVGKSRRNISELMDIRPDYANIEVDGELEQIDPEELPVGSIIIVQPGEKVPIDGIVLEGESSLNTIALTGESVPRDIHAGEEIISGCINMTGVLRIQTTKEFGESTVSKILDLVENASSRKSRSEDFIAKFAKYYTPIVCYLALALAILPPVVLLLMGMEPALGAWIYRALTFLVISCPCALVISIPLSFFAGLGGASNVGVLIKGSNYLETLSQVDTLVFDKTGTLTKGVFEVSEIHVAEKENVREAADMDRDRATGDASEAAAPWNRKQLELLDLAAHAESASSHPIGKSIIKAYAEKVKQDLDSANEANSGMEEGCIRRDRVSNIKEIGGHGVLALVDGKEVAAGNLRLMEELGVSYELCNKAGTICYLAVDRKYAGYILISDVLKDTAKSAMAELKNAGVKQLVMLTGDVDCVAQAVAKELGIHKVYSELLPGDKVSKVEELLCEGGKLAFAGDGINDAPVLSRADIGIAMGAMGSDAAIEAADVVLMDDDPMKIVRAIKIARKCMGIVYQNTIFAIGVKVLCLILGAVGIANMWLAIFADVGVMVLAVLNAIRALFVKKL